MPAAAAIDHNLIFLYKCIQHAGKIDFKSVAAVDGLTVEAARMRYFRLSKKIEAELDSPAATSAPPSGCTTQTLQAKIVLPSKKRRIGDTDGANDSKDIKLAQEVKQECKTTFQNRPLTRGKKLNYKHAQSSESELSDTDADLYDPSDSDLHDIKDGAGGDDGFRMVAPAKKSVKPKSVGKETMKAFSNQRSGNSLPKPIALGVSPPIRASEKPAPRSRNGKCSRKKSTASRMHPSNIPIPSIERSPTPLVGSPKTLSSDGTKFGIKDETVSNAQVKLTETPNSSNSTQLFQAVNIKAAHRFKGESEDETDIDIAALCPGTFISHKRYQKDRHSVDNPFAEDRVQDISHETALESRAQLNEGCVDNSTQGALICIPLKSEFD